MRKKTIEDYVEILYELQKDKKLVHTNDIANALNIRPSSVTEIFIKLSNEGYLNYKKYSGVNLTKKGEKLALNTKKKHNTLKEFLIILGVNKKIAEADACEMEHILHPSTMETIIKFVEVVQKCGFTPYWLRRLKKFIKTGKLSKCPPELEKICKEYI